MSAQAVALTVIMIVRVIVAVAVTFVRMAGGILCLLMHRLDSNRDLVWLTAGNLGGSVVNNVMDRRNRRERTRALKRN
jgi:hypothetical protein